MVKNKTIIKRFSDLPVAAQVIWAKTNGLGDFHNLLAHMLDVAAVAETLLQREPSTSRQWASLAFGISEEKVVSWAAFLVGLHDFGKAIPGFQAKWDQGKINCQNKDLKFTSRSEHVTDHGLASAYLLRQELSDMGFTTDWAGSLAQLVGCHHGYNFNPNEIRKGKPSFEDQGWVLARSSIFTAYCSVFPDIPCRPNGSPDLPALQWLAGLTCIADWVGSNQDWFPLENRAELLTEHYQEARILAGNALDSIGWHCFDTLLKENDETVKTTDELIRRIIVSDESNITARPLQAAADKLIAAANEPCLLIVEAPMGEGKTELAFLAQLRLQMRHHHRGLYVALPTQATGNAMFDRTLQFLKAFAEDTQLDIQLAHSGSMLDERVQRLRGVHGDKDEAVACSAWFSQRRRALISPYGVGTVDQALLATLNVKHHFVRVWGMANRVLVLDEVHAYDTYTSGLIEILLRWLKPLNCSVILMSATLPSKRREALLSAWGSAASDVSKTAYPRISIACGATVNSVNVAGRQQESIRVVGISSDLEVIAEKCLTLLNGGGCGAVIVNTVDRAQRLYQLMRSLVDRSDLILLHARYPVDEREERERAVLGCFSGKKRGSARLLIATQVAEQSLDLDFDFMVSDLAPVDLLLQRAGRLHRHRRDDRPDAHKVAQLFVAGLLREEIPDLVQTAWKFVYEPYLLYRTWAVASREPIWRMPEDIDRLVQVVYGDDPLPEDLPPALEPLLISAQGEAMATNAEQGKMSRNASISPASELSVAYTLKPRGHEEGEEQFGGLKAQTRLGQESITLIPVFEAPGGWRLTKSGEVFDPNQEVSDDIARNIVSRQLRVSHREVIENVLKQEIPVAFERHPWLRHCHFLLLQDGVAEFERIIVKLDPEMGLCFVLQTGSDEGDLAV